MNGENSEFYRIRVEGVLDGDWADWFDGMTVAVSPDRPGETVLVGELRDQAALHGLLNRIRDLNLRLIAVEQVTRPEEREA